MKIEAKCNSCGRTFLLSQIGPESDAPGRCPFCGARFGRHYNSVMLDNVRAAEDAAARFVHVIGMLQGMETGFDIDIEGLLREVDQRVRENEHSSAAS